MEQVLINTAKLFIENIAIFLSLMITYSNDSQILITAKVKIWGIV